MRLRFLSRQARSVCEGRSGTSCVPGRHNLLEVGEGLMRLAENRGRSGSADNLVPERGGVAPRLSANFHLPHLHVAGFLQQLAGRNVACRRWSGLVSGADAMPLSHRSMNPLPQPKVPKIRDLARAAAVV